MKNKGISLIVLIITVVVIIILGTAIIVNIARTNIIENANEAVVKQDFKTFQDELNLYIADEFAKSQGSFEVETLDAIDITEIIPSIAGSKYEEYVTIVDGKIVVSDSMPENEKKWAMEALGSGNPTPITPETPTDPETPDEPKEPVTPIVLVNTKVETANSSITGGDFAYNNPVIPVGFKAINTNEASWNDEDKDGVPDGWNNGLVIQDDDLNQFVWVPVDGTNVTYTKNFTYPSYYSATSSNTSDDIDALPTVNDAAIDETAQITKYGGFYIGRYEAGVPGKTGTPSNSAGKPTVQQGATVWTSINYTNSKASAKLFANTDNVKSGLVTGTQWDTVMKWIKNSGISVTDSRSWGNYSNSITPANVTGYGKKQVAGYSEYWKAKNIYDLAGNTWEWTGEIYSTARINRAGDYESGGSTRPASFRGYDYPSDSSGYISFRLALYIM